ncbi:major facilitator superfamily domain-containing protein [Zychaea mexicana]|uniref:major facilitator superfamily domain-containing protein n=1 Tax=Zychaea mexicana TaxID=64656 RepID=UPI0022FF4310|nr:major facilitator superfamily domain-containing protein [Zychaea mexicana]KAI9497316.1 major facilitator superfamily domain-containing protein [Zychaea mexicana]
MSTRIMVSRKVDLHVMPVLLLAELVARYGHLVVSNAKLGGLLEDLSMTEGQYRWCLSAYYFAFVILNIPITILFRRWRPSLFLTILIFSWGVLGMSTAAATDFPGFLICRIIMGASEAVYSPVQKYYISLWYKRNELAQRVGYTAVVTTLGGASVGLIAFGVSHIPTNSLNTWQWMCLIFGSPAIVLAVYAFFQIPDKPETAKFLKEEERELEIKRLKIDQGAAHDHSWSWSQVRTVLTDWKAYYFAVLYCLTGISGSGVKLALPSIIDGMGDWQPDVSQALTTPPYVLACVFILVSSYYSDRVFERAYFLLLANAIAVVAFFMIMFIPNQHVWPRYIGTCILVASTRMDNSIRSAWYTSNFSGLTRRAVASGVIYTIHAIGNALGGQIYFDPPNYRKGHTIAICVVVLQSFMILALRIILKRINKRRDAMTVEEKERELAKYTDPGQIGDRHPDFRYAL